MRGLLFFCSVTVSGLLVDKWIIEVGTLDGDPHQLGSHIFWCGDLMHADNLTLARNDLLSRVNGGSILVNDSVSVPYTKCSDLFASFAMRDLGGNSEMMVAAGVMFSNLVKVVGC